VAVYVCPSLLCCSIVAKAIDEYHSMGEKVAKKADQLGKLFHIFAGMGISYSSTVSYFHMTTTFLFVVTSIVLYNTFTVGNSPDSSPAVFQSMCFLIFCHVYISCGLGHALVLIHHPQFCSLIIYVLANTLIGETAALVMGQWIGGSRPLHYLSPNKTTVGFVAQILATFLSSVASQWVLSLPFGQVDYWVLGMLLPIFGILGDLIESFLKRCCGIKDSGNSLPGMGGMLDRMDGLLFCFPMLYFYLKFSHLLW